MTSFGKTPNFMDYFMDYVMDKINLFKYGVKINSLRFFPHVTSPASLATWVTLPVNRASGVKIRKVT